MVRAGVRQRAWTALQLGHGGLHRRPRCRRPQRHLGHYEEEPPAHQHPLRGFRGIARNSLLRRGLQDADCGGHPRPRLPRMGAYPQGQAWGVHPPQAGAQHLTPLHAHADDRIFHLCRHRHPLHAEHAHGPEFAGGHLLARHLPQPRAVRLTSPLLRRSLHLAPRRHRHPGTHPAP